MAALTFDLSPRAAQIRTAAWLTGKLAVTVLIGFLLATVLAWFFAGAPPAGVADRIGLALILSAIAASVLTLFVFASTYYPSFWPIQPLPPGDQPLPESVNLAAAASFSLCAILGGSLTQRSLERLLRSGAARRITARLQLPPDQLMPAALSAGALDDRATFASSLLKVAHNIGASSLSPEHAVAALLIHHNLRAFIRAYDLTESDIMFVAWWEDALRRQHQQRQRWWDAENLLQFTGIGLTWASGFTPLVDRLARIPRGSLWDDTIWGHESQLQELITALARQRQSNVLLVGQPGVGRLGLVRALTQRVATNSAHPALNGQRVIYLNVGELAALGESSAAQLAVIARVLREMERAGNIIAVVSGLGSLVSSGSERNVNITDLLLPFLTAPTIRVVVIVATEEYHLHLKGNSELMSAFEVVQVPSLDPKAALERLALKAPDIESQAGLTITYRALEAAVEDTADIFPHIPYPERAFDIIEQAIVVAQSQRDRLLRAEHITNLITAKVKIPVGAIHGEERQRLLNLETTMHQRLVNQEPAVTALARALIRARAATRAVNRPIGTFLFLGPTGVGKTEAAKTLAEAYFGAEEYLVRLDMSEFQGVDSVDRLIGDAQQPDGRLTSLIADRPFSIVLLDEFEKASPAVHQLFLQVFDEGQLTNARGQIVSFRHTVMIATSNAGAEFIRQRVQAGPLPPDFDARLREHVLRHGLFSPELLNRFDAVITFVPLSRDHIQEIARRLLAKLNKRLDAEHGVTVAVTPELIDFLIQIGFNPEFGARPMARAIQDTVEYYVAEKIISGHVEPGQIVTMPVSVLAAMRRP